MNMDVWVWGVGECGCGWMSVGVSMGVWVWG